MKKLISLLILSTVLSACVGAYPVPNEQHPGMYKPRPYISPPVFLPTYPHYGPTRTGYYPRYHN